MNDDNFYNHWLHCRTNTHNELADLVAEFVAKGGMINHIPENRAKRRRWAYQGLAF